MCIYYYQLPVDDLSSLAKKNYTYLIFNKQLSTIKMQYDNDTLIVKMFLDEYCTLIVEH